LNVNELLEGKMGVDVRRKEDGGFGGTIQEDVRCGIPYRGGRRLGTPEMENKG
jgi:hypothetical protein